MELEQNIAGLCSTVHEDILFELLVCALGLLFQVEWDRNPEFNSGVDGGPDGQASVDATRTLCGACVDSFSLGNLTLSISGAADFFGRLNAGNRILVSFAKHSVYTCI